MTIVVRSNEPAPKTEPAVEKSAPAKEEVKAQPALDDKSEQNAAEASEATETEEQEENETDHEDQGSESEEDKGTEPETETKPKKKGGYQKRIDKLSARVSERERELEYWKQEALKKQTAESPASKPIDAPKPNDGKPDANKFDTHADYVEALTDWKIEQKVKERESKNAQANIQKAQSDAIKAHQERMKSFSDKTEDFNEVLADADDVRVSPVIQQLIVESEHGPELLYEFARNKSELERLNKLSPLQAAREMGKIESRFTSKPSDQKTEPKKITKAPKPLEPVGSGGKGSVSKSIADPNLSQREYEALRREQIKRKTR